MLGALRRNRNSPVILFLLGIIILVFIAFFGTSTQNIGPSREHAAVVDGEAITKVEFTQRYSSVYRRYQQQYRSFDRKQAKSMDLKSKVLDQMVTGKLLVAEAKGRGLTVDDEALKKSILKNENFQTDGKFDKGLYERILNSAQMTVPAFEDYLRNEILQEKLTTVINNGTYVSSNEARMAFEGEKTSIDLEFVRVSSKPYERDAGAVTPADVKAWRGKLGEKEADEAIKKYYDKHSRTKYNVPKKIKARHILARADKAAPPQNRKAAQDKIKEAVAAIKGGMDFADAARKFSDDSTAKKGGDLGFFARGQMVGPFEDAAFALKPGEVSKIVETGFGYHIIKLEDVQEPILKKLEDVKDEISLALTKEQKASAVAEEKAKEMHAAMAGGKSLQELVDAANAGENVQVPLKVDTTGSFNKGRNYVPKIGVEKELSEAAWALTKASPAPKGPAKTEGGWIVYRLKDRTEPTKEEFEKGSRETANRLAFAKRNETYEVWSGQVRKKGDVKINAAMTKYEEN